MRPSELIEVTNAKSQSGIILCGSQLKLVLRVSPRCFDIRGFYATLLMCLKPELFSWFRIFSIICY